MRYRETVNVDAAGVSRVADIVREQLAAFGVKKAEMVIKAALAAEESAGSLAAHAPEGAKLHVLVRSFFGNMTIELTCAGERYEPSAGVGEEALSDDGFGNVGQAMIRDILLKAVAEDMKYQHLRGTNRISISICKSPRRFLYSTLGALVLAILTGFILSWIGAGDFNSLADEYFFTPVKTMYMNALKMAVAPVVFFSIVSCISRFTDLSELGRIGGRVMLMFLLTMVLAVAVGIGSYFLFRPGGSLPSETVADAASITSQKMDISFKDMIVGIIPSDFIEPFLSSNMLQLIFLAILCGIAAGKIGQYSEGVKRGFEAVNELFLKITTMIIRCMPLAVFCAICSLVLETGITTVTSVLSIFGTFIFGLFCMMVMYCVLLWVMGKTNPLAFLKEYSPTMLQIFSMASSSASIPINMGACERLGISKKVYSLSIPLGATVNMDGTCVYLSVFALAIARMYGVEITGANLIGMIITIIVLSVGAPGIPGSGLICLSVLLTQINVPAEAVGLVMGIDALVGMFRCASNCTGDVVASMIVDRTEKKRSQRMKVQKTG